MNHIAENLERWTHPSILVFGDVMLDRYSWGQVERISPEAPVPVLRATDEEARLGGAGSVASLLRAIEAKVELVGMVGNDASGRVVQRLLSDIQVSTDHLLVDDDRPTTEKWRLLGRAEGKQPHHLLRVDREELEDLALEQEEQLLQRISETLPLCAAVVISDYAKGIATPRLLRSVIDQARYHGLPVLVDPGRFRELHRYRGADCVLPNRLEATFLCGGPIEGPQDGLAAAKALCEQAGLGAMLIKLDRDGMALVDRGRQTARIIPAIQCQVQDVTGAGDMVIAALSLGLASGLTLQQAAELANFAAALEIQQLGVAPVTRQEIRAALRGPASNSKTASLEELTQLVILQREAGKRIVLTNGCFDLLHVGHVSYLQEAAAQGDVLIVAINSDASVRRLKGPRRPIIGQEDRAAMLAALECVSHVLVFEEETPHRLLDALRPDILVKGGTYTRDEVVGHEVVEAYGGEVRVLCLVEGVSTSNIVAAIQGR